MSDPVTLVRPVGRSRLVDGVTGQLRDLILNGELPPGQVLRQADLAQRLGISRTPLREAFRILEHEGFLQVGSGGNTLEVVDLTAQELVERYQIREVIDGLAARLAAGRARVASLDALELILDKMEAVLPAEGVSERARLHVEFHVGLAELSGNRHLAVQLPMIRLTALLLSRTARTVDEAPGGEPLEDRQQEHREILEAVRAGDGRAAERAARDHIRNAMRLHLPDRRVHDASCVQEQ